MSDKAEVTQTVIAGRGLIPFTGGIIFVAYAFFWPEQYGHWLGTIAHAFRTAAGF